MPFYPTQIRLDARQYLGCGTYFVTLCCVHRAPVFRNVQLGLEVLSVLSGSASSHRFSLHAFCLMPDHLHFVSEGTARDCDLVKFVNGFKQLTGFRYKRSTGKQLWQTRFYDHVLRRQERIEDVARYIWWNPVRKNLAREPCVYPLSGSQTLDWMRQSVIGSAWVPPWKADV